MKKRLLNQKTVLIFYIFIAIIIALQQYFIGQYNNFIIFREAVFHFFEHKNLYIEYPDKFFDVFLYNPSFTIFFIPFAYLPIMIGMILWTLFVTLTYYKSIISLDFKTNEKIFLLYLIIPELNTSIGNLQTNPLIVAFIIFTMVSVEKNKMQKASFYSAINFFIKGYGGIGYVFFLFKKFRIKTYLTILASFIIIFSLPLLFYSLSEFLILYKQWFWSLKQDYSINTGVSIMGIIKSLIYKEASIPLIQLVGIFVMLSAIITILINKNYENIKHIFLANILIWVIIFNQASESPTYIIASTGVFIWFLKTPKSWTSILLFSIFYILTVLSPTDIFPTYIREHFVKPYSLKALPCVLIWIFIQFQIFFPNLKSKPIIIWNKRLI
jgi:hypothetical protein